MRTVAIVSLVLLVLLIAPTLPPSLFTNAKLYLVQKITFVQCDQNNQTCIVVADSVTERELAIVPPKANEQHPYGQSGDNPFIGEHSYNINN